MFPYSARNPAATVCPVSTPTAKIETTELYDLAHDLSETTDVSAQHPEVVKQLQTEVEKARAELGDALTKRQGAGTREPGRLAPAAKLQQNK